MSRPSTILTAFLLASGVWVSSVWAQESRPQVAPDDLRLPSDWERRDLEGRWTYYQQDLDAHRQDKDRRTKWATLLGAEGEFELLEWIGVFEGWHFAGGALVAADAPQWIRVAVWNLRALDSHNMDTATQTLLGQQGRVLGWFEKYPVAQRGKGARVYSQLLEKRVEPEDPGNQLPPLDGNQVLLPFLDVPGELQDFGGRLRAEPGVRYVHQVVRALRGLTVWGEVEAVHVHKVLALTRHDNRKVRDEAFTTLTRLPRHLIPHDELLAMAEEEGPAEARRLALLAFSHGSHPKVWLELHRIASTGRHVGQGIALERLAEVGNGYTVKYLSGVEGERMGFRGAAQAQSVVSRIGKRIGQKSEATELAGFRTWIQRAAWTEVTGHPKADELGAWTERALLNVLDGPSLLGLVDDLENESLPGPAFTGVEAKDVEAAMRRWLARLAKLANERIRKSDKDR